MIFYYIDTIDSTSGGVMVSMLDEQTYMSGLSLIGCPIHLALCHIETKSFVNYYINTLVCKKLTLHICLKAALTKMSLIWHFYEGDVVINYVFLGYDTQTSGFLLYLLMAKWSPIQEL